ncbi:hypothetical protein HK405_012530 [Cladochytrium tenue]|nr:hypothetical protein HK405_012530 [Cladochytrium tenue]
MPHVGLPVHPPIRTVPGGTAASPSSSASTILPALLKFLFSAPAVPSAAAYDDDDDPEDNPLRASFETSRSSFELPNRGSSTELHGRSSTETFASTSSWSAISAFSFSSSAHGRARRLSGASPVSGIGPDPVETGTGSESAAATTARKKGFASIPTP